MKINIKLFGTLVTYFPEYNPETGMEIEFPENINVKALIAYLNIPVSEQIVITVKGHILKSDDLIKEGSTVHILQPVSGG